MVLECFKNWLEYINHTIASVDDNNCIITSFLCPFLQAFMKHRLAGCFPTAIRHGQPTMQFSFLHAAVFSLCICTMFFMAKKLMPAACPRIMITVDISQLLNVYFTEICLCTQAMSFHLGFYWRRTCSTCKQRKHNAYTCIKFSIAIFHPICTAPRELTSMGFRVIGVPRTRNIWYIKTQNFFHRTRNIWYIKTQNFFHHKRWRTPILTGTQ